jgi:hypothetical protein
MGNIPPAVFRRRPHRSHLKCLAFWWEMRSFKSSKSRSPIETTSVSSVKKRDASGIVDEVCTHSNNTMVARGFPRHRDGRASFCPSCCTALLNEWETSNECGALLIGCGIESAEIQWKQTRRIEAAILKMNLVLWWFVG